MLESLPAGADVYILKRVLMDWSDEISSLVRAGATFVDGLMVEREDTREVA
jgi:DNA-binding NarL/FixJ family response regulator